MNINEYLATHAVWFQFRDGLTGLEFKLRTPALVCADGFTLSVQASSLHYSKPATDMSPYTHVEVGDLYSVAPDLDPYYNGGVYAFVPVGVVDAIVAQHGGIAGPAAVEPHRREAQPLAARFATVADPLEAMRKRAETAELERDELADELVLVPVSAIRGLIAATANLNVAETRRCLAVIVPWLQAKDVQQAERDAALDAALGANDLYVSSYALPSSADDLEAQPLAARFATVADPLEAMRKRAETAERLLENLTPGGSEFHGSPERCAEFVCNRLAGVTRQVELRKQAEAKLAAMTLYASYCGMTSENILDFDEWLATEHCPECGGIEILAADDGTETWCHACQHVLQQEAQP